MNISPVDTARCVGGEGPLWDPIEQALYFLDNFGRKVHRFDPRSGVTRTWGVPDIVTALALRRDGGAVLTLRGGIYAIDLQDGALTQLHLLPPGCPFGFNDGKVDRRGRLILGASTGNATAPQPDGGLYRLDPDGALTQLDDGVHYSNGPCWSPDDTTLYFSDSWLKTIYAYDYDITTGQVANRRVFASTADLGGIPDGATVDADGRLWVAIYQGGKLACFAADGHLESTVEMPVALVSSVMFGGEQLDQLFVTTIAHGQDWHELDAGAGLVYRVEGLEARGLPEPRFAG